MPGPTTGPPTRRCGDCTACCTTLAIEEIEKPAFAACAHDRSGSGGRGCGVYTDRPSACRNFRCLWLDGHLGERDRPDRLGVIFTTTYEPKVGTHPLLIEYRPGALQQDAVRNAIDDLTDKSPVLTITASGGNFHPRRPEAQPYVPLHIRGQAA
jgi:hypothetical protein